MNSVMHITEPWKRQLLRLPWLLLIPFGFLLPRIAASSPNTVEQVYSSTIYPFISSAIGAFTGLFGFSVAELLIYVVVLGVISTLIISTILAIMRKLGLVRFVSIIITLLIIIGVFLNVFYIVWGFNYSRPSLYTLMDIKKTYHPIKALERLCIQLVEKATEIRPLLSENDKGVFILSGSYDSCFSELPDAYAVLACSNKLFSNQTAVKAKPVFFSKAMSAAGIAGIYVPFTSEPNVNVDQPALLLPSSAAHETAHYLGFAREDEANFISYLACMASDNPEIRYSGIMLALITCANELNAHDKTAYARLYNRYSHEMIVDIRDYNAYWDSFESPVRETATKINDSYLKSNMQSTGVKSYNLMVDLMLAYYTNLPEL